MDVGNRLREIQRVFMHAKDELEGQTTGDPPGYCVTRLRKLRSRVSIILA